MTVGTATVDSTGVATLVITVGSASQTLTAVYSGDASYATSTSPETSISSDQTPQFTLTLNPSAISLTSGQHSAATLTVSSVGTFADTMQFGCLGLPVDATCTFSATSQDLKAGGTMTAQVTVDTGNPLGSGSTTTNASSKLTFAMLPVGAMAMLALFGLRRRRKLASLLVLVIAIMTLGAATGCSGLHTNTTPAGTYTFQVVARGQNTGVAESQTVTLTVK
ncbi:MAG: hypothetical protein PW792_15500 [Acidobacteriaceae bacterium]|nr:hypothetical protein [Acidobacteriaceae bacterium]